MGNSSTPVNSGDQVKHEYKTSHKEENLMPTVRAMDNPELAAQLIESVINAPEPEPVQEELDVEPPSPTVFELPGGYVGPDGYTATEIEVRELDGRDEEAITRTRTAAAMTEQVLKRGLVRVGDVEPSDIVLNNLLSGDREFILIRIFAATFGREITTQRVCPKCSTEVVFAIDAIDDIPVVSLDSPSDRHFTIKCSRGEARVTLPTGVTQRLIQEAENKTIAELSTLLLANTVLRIGDTDVLSAADVLALPIKDRRLLADEIARRTPGPRLFETKSQCPNCEETVEVPLSMGALFQF